MPEIGDPGPLDLHVDGDFAAAQACEWATALPSGSVKPLVAAEYPLANPEDLLVVDVVEHRLNHISCLPHGLEHLMPRPHVPFPGAALALARNGAQM